MPLLDRLPGFGRNGSFGSNGVTNGNGSTPQADRQVSIPVTGADGNHQPSTSHSANPPAADADAVEPDSASEAVHSITKKTNYWFERQVYPIERQAEAWAADWAQKGLPRHDVPRTEPLEPEQVLEKLSTQVYREWQERVRTKLQDAIEDGSERVGENVATLRGALGRLEAIQTEAIEIRERITRLKADAERDVQPVKYNRIIGPSLFWPMAIFLGLVEFFANFPVLRLLLPMRSALAAAGQAAVENVDDSSWFAGPLMLFREMMMHFEATIVALVAVIVLVLLGKTLGGAGRPLAALSAKDYPLAAQTVRAHRRQQWLVAGASLLGIGFVLSFLFYSRQDIARTTAERVQSEAASLDTARREAAQATTPGAIAAAAQTVSRTERMLSLQRDDADFAKTVQQNNVPILFLNIGLVLTAMVLGFCYKEDDLGEKRGEHPEIPPLRERMFAINREMADVAREGRTAVSQAHLGISRVHHLLRANPLKEWQAKVDRLESIIPRFRGENARLRGLDPANIRAFDIEPDLNLPPIEPAGFHEPEEFARLKSDFSDVAQRFALLAPRLTPAQASGGEGE